VKESEVRKKLKELKGTTLYLDLDEKTGKVIHGEIHDDEKLIWKWPKGSKTRLTPQSWKLYGKDGKNFSMKRKDYCMAAMEKFEV
jgi:hypothetical protein